MRLSVRASVHPETRLIQYLEEYSSIEQTVNIPFLRIAEKTAKRLCSHIVVNFVCC